ncbi:MAG: pantoate--beta-alanine ligase [Candidatus Dadabacteria bacterium]|nr:pantoate--beta-alanine ligase [Candidatus Dadabacteria bacterium]NIS10135.1 pantoate--beta-alanine ligase [Candidatus Dadabacteria bacterium]NIY23057.1 pantoate--beta-alanine ligase [Candidatus Dadabacteria bacterium]
MKLIDNIADMKAYSDAKRSNGAKISFVPTMGALHDGHLQLVKNAANIADICVVSIFVNPAQFGPSEDFGKYPRDLDRDKNLLKELGVDAIFFPKLEDMYGDGFQTYVEVEEIQKPLCGKFRPGHFRGVATVVLKLFNIVKPHYAVFGEKDYQQLQVIRRMVSDLNVDVEVISHPIVRERSGLAMSSRNEYLKSDKREEASSISDALFNVKRQFDSGVKEKDSLLDTAYSILNEVGINEIEYLEIVDGQNLTEKKSAGPGDVVAIAARLGGTRLIDNMRL